MDKKNDRNKWSDCVKLEIDKQRQHDTYSTWVLVKILKTTIRFVLTLSSTRHKDRLIDYEHLPDVPLSSVYSDVASLRRIR